MTKLQNNESRLSEVLLAQAGEFISGCLGLYFPKNRQRDLERGLCSVAPEFGFEDPEACTKWLVSSILTKSQIEVLAGHFTVGETYFFRDKKHFAFLEEKILPELIELRRTTGKYLRIWSAGCCSGEEPYSLAILLHKIMGDPKDWNISILGTDINPVFLRKASAGIYGEWSFRDTPAWVREKYFTKTKENRFELLPKIRKRVSFTYHNLVQNSYPSLLTNTNTLDLILCRNVLMYLTPNHQNQVTGKLHQCLTDGGWLITGPSESMDALYSEFVGVKFQEATFYRRQETKRGSIVDWQSPMEKQLGSSNFQSTIATQQSSVTPGGSATDSNKSTSCEQPSPIENHQPSIPESSIALARTAADRGSLPEALGYCEKALAADRFNPGYYYLRASILQEQGRWHEAAADLRKALYLDQNFIPAYILLGNLSLRQGNKRGSARYFRNALRLLDRRPTEEIISHAEGLTAGRLMEIIRSTIEN